MHFLILFLQWSGIGVDDVTVDCHFTKISSHIFVFDSIIFLRISVFFFWGDTKQNLYISFSLCHRQILLSLVLRSSDFCVFNLGQGSLNCWFSGSVYTLPVLAIYRWHSRRKRVFKKEPSINKVLREEKEDIEAQKYDASMILWYSKI